MTMFAVGSNHGVLWLQTRNHSSGDCFLSDIKVQETADLSRLVLRYAFFLEPTHPQHLP
jgi:hypothetical protein